MRDEARLQKILNIVIICIDSEGKEINSKVCDDFHVGVTCVNLKLFANVDVRLSSFVFFFSSFQNDCYYFFHLLVIKIVKEIAQHNKS